MYCIPFQMEPIAKKVRREVAHKASGKASWTFDIDTPDTTFYFERIKH